MFYQITPITPLTDLSPLIELGVIVLMIALMLFCYFRFKYFEAMALIFGVSCIFTVISLSQNVLIYTPYIQLFFILFQLIILYIAWLKTK